MFTSIDSTLGALAAHGYIAERGLATSIYLSVRMGKPLFLEGEAGVGKTEIAKVLAALLDTELIRMQCYEGLDAAAALYEWNYAAQLLHLRLMEASGADAAAMQRALFSREFLLARPLLRAVEAAAGGRPPVLLIDELDRADEEFEAFLLELLSDFQITIPELGTIRAETPPVVVITSNRTREIHDALKRRCLYHWIEYPSFQKELAIIRAKAPGVTVELARWIAAFMGELRQLDLFKAPGVAESIDWAAALAALDQRALSPEVVTDTLGVILKYQDDIEAVGRVSVETLIERARVMAEIAV
jgi:MoxR-like ATPase